MKRVFKDIWGTISGVITGVLLILTTLAGWWAVETTYYYLWHQHHPKRYKMEKPTPPTNLVTTLDEP
jgi:hypothetical protein